MIKNYAIYQPQDSPEHSIDKLISHALQAIEKEAKGNPVKLIRFDLIYPGFSDEEYGIHYQFHDMDDKELERRNRNIKFTKEKKTSYPTEDLEYVGASESSQLKGIIIRLPQGEKQYDGILLAKNLAEKIKDLGNIKVYDFVYHDFTDNDGINHPYFTLYYTAPAK